VAIYHRNWLLPLVLNSAALAFLFYTLLPDIETGQYFLGLFLIAYAIVTAGILILGRRAIILTRDALISRPVLGHPVRVPFASIIQFSVIPARSLPIIIEFLIRLIDVPWGSTSKKLEIRLSDGKAFKIPLDVGRKSEILPYLNNNVRAVASSRTAVPPSS
jgi:hypothetical protein